MAGEVTADVSAAGEDDPLVHDVRRKLGASKVDWDCAPIEKFDIAASWLGRVTADFVDHQSA